MTGLRNMGLARVTAGVILVALIMSGVVIGGRWTWCQWKVDGETIGGLSVETFGEYERVVHDESSGCTRVELVGLDGAVVDDPDPGMPIEPMTGQMLSQRIRVFERHE